MWYIYIHTHEFNCACVWCVFVKVQVFQTCSNNGILQKNCSLCSSNHKKTFKKSHQNHWDFRHRNENTASVLHLLSLANQGCNAASFEMWNHQADVVMFKCLPTQVTTNIHTQRLCSYEPYILCAAFSCLDSNTNSERSWSRPTVWLGQGAWRIKNQSFQFRWPDIRHLYLTVALHVFPYTFSPSLHLSFDGCIDIKDICRSINNNNVKLNPHKISLYFTIYNM